MSTKKIRVNKNFYTGLNDLNYTRTKTVTTKEQLIQGEKSI